MSNSARSDFWKSASNAPAQPSQTRYSCFAWSKISTPALWMNFCRWSYSRPQMLPRRSRLLKGPRQELTGLAVGREAATRADDDGRVLDADRARLLARAARGALPQHVLVVQVDELQVELAGEQRLLVLEDQRLRVQQLAGRVGRAVLHAAAALDARERVEARLAWQVLDGLESHFLLLEVEVGHRLEPAATSGRRSAARSSGAGASSSGSARGSTGSAPCAPTS